MIRRSHAILFTAAAGFLAARAIAAPSEYALLTFSGANGISWSDSAGTRGLHAAHGESAEQLYASLTDGGRLDVADLASQRTDVLALNALSAKDWELVNATITREERRYLLRRPAALTTTTRPSVTAGPAATADGLDVAITGGHETDPRDGGRPVALVAGALGVTPDVFRDAFSHVTPARGNDGGPTPDQARANKQALMSRLGPLGVTNDRLDAVSNEYRYRGDRGETWPQTPAKLTAQVIDGRVTSVTIVDAGAGYTTPPILSVPGAANAALRATLAFGPDFATNGSIASVVIGPKP